MRNSTFRSNFTAYWSTLFLYEVTVRDHYSLSDRTDPFIEGVKKCKDKEERYVWVWQSCQQVHHYYCWTDHARLLETELDEGLPTLLQNAVKIDSSHAFAIVVSNIIFAYHHPN